MTVGFTNETNNLMVVDGLNLAFRWKWNKASNFAEEYLKTIRSLSASYDASRVIVLSDWGQSTYRLELDPQYKANRKELRETQTEEEAQDFQDFLDEFNKALTLCDEDGFDVIKIHGVEADDIAAYISINFDKDQFDHVWLISSDGDWDTLVNNNVSRFSYVTRKEYTLENWEEEHGCNDPTEFVSIKALEGDKGDNIPGVEGVGPKRAQDLVAKYGSVFDLCEYLPLSGTAKYIKNLNESKDRIMLNIDLVDLVSCHEDAIGSENIEKINQQIGEVLS